MCGITGWVDFSGDLIVEGVCAMTDTLVSRGPDAHGVWFGPRAGLGHTRNSVIDVGGGSQPMIADGESGPLAVLTYSGEIYNFRELRTELEGRGHRFRTRSDSEVVLRSYLEWGDDCGNHLEGMFAFAVWDVRTEELLLVRDRLGIKPLFYAQTRRGLLFASEPKALLASGQVRPIVDADGLRELFSTAKTPGQAVFRDMKELLPGHTLRYRPGGAKTRRYWRLEVKPHTDDFNGTIAHVRSLLTDIVTRELVADVPLCSLLSGGLGSSTIAALANAARLKAGDEPVRTITTTFAGDTGNHAADVALHVGTDHTDIVLGAADLTDPQARLAALLSQDMLGDRDTSAYLRFRATREHFTVALSGEAADEIFGGFNGHDPAEAGQGRALFDPTFMRKLDMVGYYADSYQAARAEVPHVEGEDPAEFRMREQSSFHLTRRLPMLLDRDDRLAMASGLEVRVPFCDHRLVEYVYNTPWKFKSFDGREKSLLRAAVRDLLPNSVLSRPKSPYPVIQDPAYTQALHRELKELLADPESPVLPLLDVAAGEEPQSRINVETVLAFNAWMRQHNVELAV